MIEGLMIAGAVWLAAGAVAAVYILDGWRRQGREIVLPRDPLHALGCGLIWCSAILVLVCVSAARWILERIVNRWAR